MEYTATIHNEEGQNLITFDGDTNFGVTQWWINYERTFEPEKIIENAKKNDEFIYFTVDFLAFSEPEDDDYEEYCEICNLIGSKADDIENDQEREDFEREAMKILEENYSELSEEFYQNEYGDLLNPSSMDYQEFIDWILDLSKLEGDEDVGYRLIDYILHNTDLADML